MPLFPGRIYLGKTFILTPSNLDLASEAIVEHACLLHQKPISGKNIEAFFATFIIQHGDMPESSAAESTRAPASNIIPTVQSWLDNNAKKIQQFWIGADWRLWARYDLFIALENAFEDGYLVNHGIPIWESYNEDEQVDILMEHRDGGTNITIRLRCENVNDNCGSFEDFSKEYRKDWTLLQDLNQHAEPEHEDTKVMLLGFSGQPMVPDEDEEPLFGELKPESFKSGEVYAWYLYDEIKKADKVEDETSS